MHCPQKSPTQNYQGSVNLHFTVFFLIGSVGGGDRSLGKWLPKNKSYPDSQQDNWNNFSLTFPHPRKPEIMLPISHINKTGNIHETNDKRPCMYPFIHSLMTSVKDIIVSATVLDSENL